MHGIRIKPNRAGSGLGFDLREILSVLGDELLKVSEWKVRFVEFIGTTEINSPQYITPVAEGIAQFRIEHRKWSNKELKEFAEIIVQTFDGEIVGYKKTPNGKQIYIHIIAFDTSWWDVLSPDEKVLAAIEAGFQTTQRIESKDAAPKITGE